MLDLWKRYTLWLHTQWPAGTVEKLPVVNPDGTCALPGVYIVGDLTGIPLLKFALDSGARAVRSIVADAAFQAAARQGGADTLDVLIVGGGVAGMAAALEARKQGLRFEVVEPSRAFSTVANFPAGKPIYTYPSAMTPQGDLQVSAQVKEALLEELEEQRRAAGIEPRTGRVERLKRRGGMIEAELGDDGGVLAARRVVVAIGRSGAFRSLGVPGEDLPKVLNRLLDPKDYAGQDVVVVGGGDSAVEAAIALAGAGARVTLAYRRASFDRAKPENVEGLEALERAGKLTVLRTAQVLEVGADTVTLQSTTGNKTLPNTTVFALIGREAPLEFFRRSGIPIAGEGTPFGWTALALFLLFCVVLYNWKSGGWFATFLPTQMGGWPSNMPSLISGLGSWFAAQVADRSTLVGTVAVSMKGPSFYYTLVYSACVVGFGIDRMLRRRTPYVRVQTLFLMFVQVFPLFLLPEVILPWLGYNGHFAAGGWADRVFDLYVDPTSYAAAQWPDWGHPRAYWRAYGFILAWPLFIYNVFSDKPMVFWLVVSFVQTFVLIPGLIYFWGKGAYCGWICSCGALAETLGDRHRTKMPHGPFWNKMNMVGQVILGICFALLALRIAGWIWPNSWVHMRFNALISGKTWSAQAGGDVFVNPLNYKWVVDVLLGGILGVGLYFKYSARVWCRFACPLAALMHIFARFSSFRIFAEKSKCISCNACTTVCHQGIDVMSFANKGRPMEDPECVRCSACVQSCPTGVLQFGRVARDGRELFDMIEARSVREAK